MKYVRFSVFALSVLIAVTVQAQDQSSAYYQAGNTLYGQKNYDMAIRYYQAAVQVNPQMWQADQGLGNCYYAKGDKVNALASYQKALDINPNNPGLSNFVQTLRAQVPAAPAAQVANPRTAQPEMTNPVANAAARNHNLPKEGGIVFKIAESDWIGSWTDVENLVGGGTYASTPIGVGIDLGADYVFSSNLLVGLKLEALIKQPEQVDYSGFETYTFSETAIGAALEGEGIFPISDGINFIGSLNLGFYTLVGSTLVGTGFFNQSADLAGSGPGGRITAGVELLMDSSKSWAVDISAQYQAISFSPITETISGSGGTSGTMKNADGSNANLDFSGPGLSLGVRFF